MPDEPGARRPDGLVRQDPFDGLTPRDFLDAKGTWPEGPFTVPAALRIPVALPPHERAAAERSAWAVHQAVAELAAEVQEHLRWRKRTAQPASTVARQIGVSRARLSALEHGTNWPRWDLLMRLRALRRRDEQQRAVRAAENEARRRAARPPGIA